MRRSWVEGEDRIRNAGRNTAWSYYDVNGEPIPGTDGFEKLTRKYTANGDIAEERTYDASGNPVNREKGYATVFREWNQWRQLVREEFYDQNNHLTDQPGYAILERTYDDRGTLIKERRENANQ